MVNLTFFARRKTRIVPMLLTCAAMFVGLPAAVATAAPTDPNTAELITKLLYTADECCNATPTRISAIDSFRRIEKSRLGDSGPKVAAALAPLLSKQMVCPRDHDLLRLHVLQTLEYLGPAAIGIVHEIVRFQSSDATVLEAKNSALDAILAEEKVKPETASAPPKPENQNAGAKESIEIVDGLKHADADVRLVAVKRVIGKPDPGFLVVIVPLMSADPDVDVRRLAADATNHVIGRMKEESQAAERNEWLVKYVDGLASMLKRKDDGANRAEKNEAAKPQFKQERLFALGAMAAVVRDHSTAAAAATAKGRILEAQDSTDPLVKALANAINPKTGKPKDDQTKSDEKEEKKDKNGPPAAKVEK